MKKALLITYYWPPMGGSGVQRWLKFVKYLPEYGWDTIVYMPSNPSFQLEDPSLLQDVRKEQVIIKHPIREPHHLFYRAKGQRDLRKINQGDILDKKKKSWLEKVGLWMRGNLFLPDPRIFWVRPSVKFLLPKLQEHQIDVIITTGPPHSLHLIGKRLKEKTGIPWVADFRDPWTSWIFMDEFYVSSLAMRVQKHLERKVLQAADKVLTVSPSCCRDLEQLGNRPVVELTNGFDEEDFQQVSKAMPQDKFRICYFGTIDRVRDPRSFLNVVKQLCHEVPDFQQQTEIKMVGYLSNVIMEEIQADEVLRTMVRTEAYMPHQQMLQEFSHAALLLLLLNNTAKSSAILTGKFFEYLASGKPILALGNPEGDIAQVLGKTQAGAMHVPDDSQGIRKTLLHYYKQYRQGTYAPRSSIAQYSRAQLSRQLSEVLNELAKVKPVRHT